MSTVGEHKREFCRRNLHRLEKPNIFIRDDGTRECKICKYETTNRRLRNQRQQRKIQDSKQL